MEFVIGFEDEGCVVFEVVLGEDGLVIFCSNEVWVFFLLIDIRLSG